MSWIVVSTHPHREGLARDNLIRQNYNVYCPMLLKQVRHARRSCEAQRPLFPGYLFLERTSSFVERPIWGTYGVRTVLRNGDAPALLPRSFVASLKAREIGGVIRDADPVFRQGQAVTIDGGPFDGIVGKIMEVRESDRILLLLDLIHGQVKLNVDAGMLRSA